VQGTLLLAGKLGRQSVNAVRPGRLVYIKDHISGVFFLVDSGAAVSMVPGPVSSSHRCSIRLENINGDKIPTGGERRFGFNFAHQSGLQSFSWDFVIGSVSCPILGGDFLSAHKLLVDLDGGCLRSKTGGKIFTGQLSASPTISAAALRKVPESVAQLLQRHPGVVNSSKLLPPVKHSAQHHLITKGQPVCHRFRRLDGDKLRDAKQIFAEWERSGIVRRSSSNWSSPLHMVRKKDGSWRACGDFRRLNLATEADKYPVPNLADCMTRVTGARVFSTLDLRNGYLQVPLHPSAVKKTAVITPFGLYEFLRMPFGLKNAGMSFQRLMDQVLQGLDFVVVYIDDILVASTTMEQHIEHLESVFTKLEEFGLVLNLEKCCFAKSTVDFLGHRLSAAGCSPLPSKVSAILDHPRPTTVKELQQFLGLANFYRKFIPAAAAVLAPLTNALRGSPAGGKILDWSAEMESSFVTAKSSLASSATLAHPHSAAALSLVADASATHVGAALQQLRPGSSDWEPLGFFSKKLDKAQSVYSAFDRELFAAYSAIRHFRSQLEGRRFQLWTDHKPLTFALSRCTDAWSPRQQRQLSFIAEFTADIRHVAGSKNVVADALSRPPASSTSAESLVSSPGSPATCAGVKPPAAPASSPSPPPGPSSAALQPSQPPAAPAVAKPPAAHAGVKPPAVSASPPVPIFNIAASGVDLAALAAAQLQCPSTAELISSPSLRVQKLDFGGTHLYCDTSTGLVRPLVPDSFRTAVFNAVHSLAHPGIRATKRLTTSRWVWRKMSSDIAALCRDCQDCQRGKVTKQPAASPDPIAVPSRRFSHIHVDLVGPLPTSSAGHNHILTVVDRSTRWLEAIPLSSTTAVACADALVAGWISRFGVPDILTSDRGVQFTSAVWSSLMSRLGVTHNLTTAYHPQANGLVERAHRQLKDALRCRLAGQDWVNHLPWVLLGLRSAPKEDSGISSAELVYGAPLSLPSQPPSPSEAPPAAFTAAFPVDQRVVPLRPLTYAEAVSSPSPALAAADLVYIRRGGAASPLAPCYSGPYKVLSKSPKSFTLDLGGYPEVVSIDRLKPHSGPSPAPAADPPRRGRPPSSPSPAGPPPGRG